MFKKILNFTIGEKNSEGIKKAKDNFDALPDKYKENKKKWEEKFQRMDEKKLREEEERQSNKEVSKVAVELSNEAKQDNRIKRVQEEPSKIEEAILELLNDGNYKGLWTEGNIPSNKLNNAREHFPIGPRARVLGLIDCTIFGSCKVGLAITDKGLVWGNTISSTSGSLSWRALANCKKALKFEDNSIFFSYGTSFSTTGCPMNKDELLSLLKSIIELSEASMKKVWEQEKKRQREKRKKQEEINKARAEKRKEQRVNDVREYGEKVVKALESKKLCIDMPRKFVVKIYGSPEDKKKTTTKTKIKERLYYKPVKSSRGNISYQLEIIIENGNVVGWKEN